MSKETLTDSYKAAFAKGTAGERVLKDLMERFHVLEDSAAHTNSNLQAHWCGERNVVLYILGQLHRPSERLEDALREKNEALETPLDKRG
jgi:hypothetical protein